ncbi:MAG: hypothetical protein QOG35_2048 [Solirubrobacteraceae bacterium]|nr:hypothetical protein [Solirubrobacteraceae bacterium]
MLEGTLRTVSVVTSAIVVLSFAMFAIDDSRAASQRSAAAVAGLQATATVDPSPREERAREKAHSTPRELIDDADDILLAPFAGISDGSSSTWVRRGIPALVALVVYGFGLSFVARFSRGRA